jgi:hypothetical protein
MAVPKRKMSEVLLELVEPYRSEADSGEKLEQLIATAVVAWNAGLLPEARRERFLRDAGRDVCGSDRKSGALLVAAVRELLDRRQRLFPRDERFIVNYQLTTTHGKDRLEVATLSGAKLDLKSHPL